jgi:hypothetical protein
MHRVGVGGRMHGDRAMPISLQARRMRSAISPRLAIRTLENMPASMISSVWPS